MMCLYRIPFNLFTSQIICIALVTIVKGCHYKQSKQMKNTFCKDILAFKICCGPYILISATTCYFNIGKTISYYIWLLMCRPSYCYLSVELASWNSTVDLSDPLFCISISSLSSLLSLLTTICSSSSSFSDFLSGDDFLGLRQRQQNNLLAGFDGIDSIELLWSPSSPSPSAMDSPLVLNCTSFLTFPSVSSTCPGMAFSSNPEISSMSNI